MTRTIAFAEVAEIIRGVTYDKNEARTSAEEGYLPILRAGNVQDTLETDRDPVWVPASRVRVSQRLQRGDIAIAVSSGSAALVGKTALLMRDWNGVKTRLIDYPLLVQLWLV